MNPLKRLYLKRIQRDSEFNQLYEDADDNIQTETVNLVDALFKGYMQDSKLATMLSVNPDIHNLLKRCKNNLFKSLQTAKRILVKFNRVINDSFADEKTRKQNDALIEMMFEDGEHSFDAENGRMNFVLNQDLHDTLEQGDKLDNVAMQFAGRGLESGEGQGLDPERLKLFAESAAMDILDQFGRFDRFINTTQKRRKEHGIAEVKDITMGNDIPNMLDDHYLELIHPKMRTLFFQQFAEEELLQMELEEEVPEESGPVSIFVDFSGSMHRYKPIAAGFALAGFKHIEDAGRYVELHTYADSLVDSVNSDDGSLYDALAVLARPLGGGTQFGTAFSQAIGNGLLGDHRSDGDIIVITDGVDVYKADSEIRKLKEQGIKFSILYINQLNKIGDHRNNLAQLFDTVLVVDRLTKGDNDAQDLTKKLYSLTEQIL